MAVYERETGAWIFTDPVPGRCDLCGIRTRINEDGWCGRCAAKQERKVRDDREHRPQR